MPDFHPHIKDLITRMLTVDVDSRITISEIKAHPAFRLTMPPIYVAPSPFPYVNTLTPIDSVSDDVKQCLAQIGIEETEMKEALMSSENNIVKIFTMMLLNRVKLEDLPWDLAHIKMNPVEADTRGDFVNFCVAQKGQRERKTESVEYVHTEGFSLVQKPDWELDFEEEFEFDESETFGPVCGPVWELMTELESISLENNFSFLHPNDMQLIGKDNNSYIHFDTWFETPETLMLQLQMKNVIPEQRIALCDAIRSRVKESGV